MKDDEDRLLAIQNSYLQAFAQPQATDDNGARSAATPDASSQCIAAASVKILLRFLEHRIQAPSLHILLNLTISDLSVEFFKPLGQLGYFCHRQRGDCTLYFFHVHDSQSSAPASLSSTGPRTLRFSGAARRRSKERNRGMRGVRCNRYLAAFHRACGYDPSDAAV